ncbi:hypothetical protein GCM10010441_07740 [Kitasatospora paracochleata]
MFEFPDDLKAAQARLELARAAHHAYLADLPKWTEPRPERTLPDGTVVPAEPGWNPDMHDQADRLIEAERQAAHAVWAHPFWKTLETGDIVDARTALKHLEPADA